MIDSGRTRLVGILVAGALVLGVPAVAAAQPDPRDTPLAEFSVGLALGTTSCYVLAAGGPTCRGSVAGEVPGLFRCGIPEGCHQEYGGVVVAAARSLSPRWAVAGEVSILPQAEGEPSDLARSALMGPKMRVWRAYVQALVGPRWHRLFSDGLVVQPGIGFDVGHDLGFRLQVDYPIFSGEPRLSGLRVQVGIVAHMGRLQ